MSQILINISNPSKFERIAVNAVNMASQAARNLAVNTAKNKLYEIGLGTFLYSDVEKLTIEGIRSPYTSNGELINNALILDNQNGVQFIFFDVKLSVTRSNTIKETVIAGRQGTIKEFIQANDYDVRLQGNLIALRQNSYPINELKELIQLLAVENEFLVSSKYLDAFSINKLVLMDANFDQASQTYFNVLPFSLSLKSDNDYQLVIKN